MWGGRGRVIIGDGGVFGENPGVLIAGAAAG